MSFNLIEFVKQQESLFIGALTDSSVSWAKECQFAIQHFQRNQKLAEIAISNPISAQNAIINVAAIGISLKKVVKSNQRFMSEISDYQKEDVLTWWKSQPFDLQLEEHLGNCVFCIKKGINKVALAMRDEPEMAARFREVIMSESVRVVERRQQENKVMYRKSLSLDAIAEMYSGHSREEIAATIRGNKAYESGSCSEGCEAFIVDNGQMDLFDSI